MKYENLLLLREMEGKLHVSVKFIGNLAKFIAALSIPLGVLFLSVYFKHTSTPFPIMDASLSVFVSIFLVTFCFLFVLCALFIIPSTYFLKRTFLEEFLPHLRSQLTGPLRRPTKKFARRATLEYLTFYSPFLSLVMFLIIVYCVNFFMGGLGEQHGYIQSLVISVRGFVAQLNSYIFKYQILISISNLGQCFYYVLSIA